MSRVELTGLGNLIVGSCLIVGRNFCVLYDSGVTHSFMSKACVQELSLLVRELQYDLMVSASASGLLKTIMLCARCPMGVEGLKFKVNLIFLLI